MHCNLIKLFDSDADKLAESNQTRIESQLIDNYNTIDEMWICR